MSNSSEYSVKFYYYVSSIELKYEIFDWFIFVISFSFLELLPTKINIVSKLNHYLRKYVLKDLPTACLHSHESLYFVLKIKLT